MRGFNPIFITTMLICPILSVLGGAGECRRYLGARTLDCYDCDSRYDDLCEHIDRANLTAKKPKIKSCQGCCVKFSHKYPDRKLYIQRTCTEHLIINYFMVDHVCMSEGKDRGRMCFCEDNLCNQGFSFQVSSISQLPLLYTVMAILVCSPSTIDYFV